ncbi:MAG: hypothetical protein H5T69_02560 [Chloroflexi bacterium]|nr:hypothetical protein [Chloroflexota bacterium]
MEFGDLLDIVGDEPVFESALLLAGDVNAADVRPFLERSAEADLLIRENLERLLFDYQERPRS